MAQELLTIELHFEGHWHQAAELTVLDAGAGVAGQTRFAYLDDYIERNIEALETHDARTVGENYPLQYEVWPQAGWPAFTLDIMPSGAARRWWSQRLTDQDLSERELDLVLLRDHTISPIGHLRIGRPPADTEPPIPFTKDEVCRRSTSFLEHAAELGAAIGGATGAGGDAPKVLLVEDAAGNIYPDAALPDENVEACWLVKWPRGRDTNRDRLVLQTEYLYAHALAELGLPVCPGQWRHLDDARPSLWMPRFDRVVADDGLHRLAVESFYSLAGVRTPGASVSHLTFLDALAKALERRGQIASLPGLVREYVCRDLLDVVLGNSDNHGRNRAVLRGPDLALAPIYDLAPMVMDPEGVVRTTRWGEHEKGGRIDWRGVCGAVSDFVDPALMEAELRDFGARLLALPDLLRDAGLDDEVMEFPRIYLGRLPEALTEWGLR